MVFWKPFRVIISLICFLSITFLFIDFRQILPSEWYDGFTYLQFLPSLLKFIAFAGFLSLGFVIVTLLTLLFGRVYCSTICPLGVFQDIISFFSRKFRTKRFRFKYSRPNNFLRYSILVLAAIVLLFGNLTLLYILDPYSSFGRFASDFGRPVFIAINNFLAGVLIKFKVYALSPFEIAHFDWLTVIIPAALLILVVWLSVTRGRLYCNTVCPVGSLLGLISKYSLYKIQIDTSKCNQCAKCAFVCKAQCISAKERKVDFTRCVGCFNCLNACDSQSINYRFSRPYTKNKPKAEKFESTDASKRQFIAGSLLLTGALFGISRSSRAAQTSGKSGDKPVPIKKQYVCSPPGSKGLSRFNDYCTACHLCVSACPNGILQPSFMEYGLSGMLQPYMDCNSGFCNYDCTECGEVCPTGAIMPLTVEEKHTTQVGIVHFIKQNCVVYTDRTSCGSCSEHCPTQAVRMVPFEDMLFIPQVDVNICVGCGGCEHVCPAKPYKAIYVEGNPVHQLAKKPEIKKLDQKQTDEFPF
jgi:ferredoxin